jgi:hypothetical protein
MVCIETSGCGLLVNEIEQALLAYEQHATLCASALKKAARNERDELVTGAGANQLRERRAGQSRDRAACPSTGQANPCLQIENGFCAVEVWVLGWCVWYHSNHFTSLRLP